MVSKPSIEGLYILGVVSFASHFDQMEAESTSTAVGAASSAKGSGVQVENKALQLHGADHLADAVPYGTGEMFDHVNRAYSMVQSVERQNEIHMEITETGDHAAMQRRTGVLKDVSYKGDQKRRSFVDKRQQYYEHCAKSDHIKDTVLRFMAHRICIRTWWSRNVRMEMVRFR
ncbi:UNVERIFIED_CONTAM: hypothetical protein Sradi_3299000 [Sesamum radiatum]|uniref:Uncharacterized protein n=1 Tax=Sesamum radiatum TaxID=300843 RepID=A0AAW2R2Q1_SESRA